MNTLPKEILDFIEANRIYDGLEPILLRYNLDPLDQLGAAEVVVRLFVCGSGVGHPRDLHTKLKDEINDSQREDFPTISDAVAIRIVNDIKAEVLAPLKPLLISLHPDWAGYL